MLIFVLRWGRRLVNACFYAIVIVSVPFIFPLYALAAWWGEGGGQRDD